MPDDVHQQGIVHARPGGRQKSLRQQFFDLLAHALHFPLDCPSACDQAAIRTLGLIVALIVMPRT